MEKITGIVESRDVKDVQGRGKFAGQTNQKIALKVNGANYSAFDNAVPADVAERLGAIRPGDEVDLTFEDVPGTWQGKAVTYHNIKDIIKVTRPDTGGGELSRATKEFIKGPVYHQSTSEDKPRSKTAGDTSRDDMMRLSYSKDTIIAAISRGHINPREGETEELFLARVFSLIKAGAKTLGE